MINIITTTDFAFYLFFEIVGILIGYKNYWKYI